MSSEAWMGSAGGAIVHTGTDFDDDIDSFLETNRFDIKIYIYIYTTA